MTVLEMISDVGEDEIVEGKKNKRIKINKYGQYSRFGVDMTEPAKNEGEDTEPFSEFPANLLEEVDQTTAEASTRFSAAELRAQYKICIGARHASHPIYQTVLNEVRAYLDEQMIKLRSFDIQGILVHARLNGGKIEYYCQISTKNFDITGELDAKTGNFSAKAEL